MVSEPEPSALAEGPGKEVQKKAATPPRKGRRMLLFAGWIVVVTLILIEGGLRFLTTEEDGT